MESYLPLVIQLVSGAIGGVTAGKSLKKHSLGPLGNIIAGIIGGGLGGQLLAILGTSLSGGGLDLNSVIGDVAGGGVGGGILMAIIGMVKSSFSKTASSSSKSKGKGKKK